MWGAQVYYRNIFVLSPGRSGSKTFSEACQHLSNYSSAHESLSNQIGDARFAYPAGHIEVDNRLCWFLGDMQKRFSSSDTLYIYLKRDFDKTAESFLHRLKNSAYRASIMGAFAHGIIMKSGDWKPEEEERLARFYVETVQANIESFLKLTPHLVVSLEDGGESFRTFLAEISAEGEIEKALQTWRHVYNAR
jgi:hypothetical protein